MMKQMLERMFKPSQPTTVVATVQERVTETRYRLVDDSGRIFIAISGDSWPAKRRVLVQNGRIVQSAGKAGTIKNYNV